MARIEDLELGAMLPSLPFSDKDVNNVRFYLYTSPSPVVVGSSPGGGAESNAGGGGGVDKRYLNLHVESSVFAYRIVSNSYCSFIWLSK